MACWLSVVFLGLLLPSATSAQGDQTLVDILLGGGGGGAGGGGGGGGSLSSTLGNNNNIYNSNPGPSSGVSVHFNPQTLSANTGSNPTFSPSSSSSNTGSSPTFSFPSSSSSSSSSAAFSRGLNPNVVARSSLLGSFRGNRMGQGTGQAVCSAGEKRTLFNNCAMNFGLAHMSHFPAIQRKRPCDTSFFNCGHVDTLIKCVNSQPVNVVSNRCWPVVDTALTGFLHQYRLPCSYADLKRKCEKTSADLIPIEQRQQNGQGMNTNPMTMLMRIIMRRAMPMIMMGMMGGGGMGALFGA